MLPLLLDQGLPARAAVELRARGWDILHVSEIRMSQSDDSEILDHAAAEGRTVVTLDLDFPALLALAGRRSPSVLLLRLQGLGTPETIQLIEDFVPLLEADLAAGAIAVHTGSELRVRRLPIGTAPHASI